MLRENIVRESPIKENGRGRMLSLASFLIGLQVAATCALAADPPKRKLPSDLPLPSGLPLPLQLGSRCATVAFAIGKASYLPFDQQVRSEMTRRGERLLEAFRRTSEDLKFPPDKAFELHQTGSAVAMDAYLKGARDKDGHLFLLIDYEFCEGLIHK